MNTTTQTVEKNTLTTMAAALLASATVVGDPLKQPMAGSPETVAGPEAAIEVPLTMEQQIAALRAENDRLRTKNASAGKLSLKVSDKGAISIYGMGRFPVTLYREQMERLIAHVPEIQAFIKANVGTLSVKE